MSWFTLPMAQVRALSELPPNPEEEPIPSIHRGKDPTRFTQQRPFGGRDEVDARDGLPAIPQVPASHSANPRPPVPGVNDLVTTHPEVAAQWHPHLNDMKAHEVSAGSKYKATWTGCPANPLHVWTLEVRTWTAPGRSGRCPICTGRQFVPGMNDLATTHPELAAQWHPDLNDQSPHELGRRSTYVATWTNCEKHPGHIWRVAVRFRTQKPGGCNKCTGRAGLPSGDNLAILRPDLAAQWSPENANPPSHYLVKSNEEVWWVCEQGHPWPAPICQRTAKDYLTRCPFCSNRKLLTGYNDLATQRPDVAKEWDTSKNGFPPSDILVGSGYNAHWYCACGNTWRVAVYKRTSYGQGCRNCSGKNTEPEVSLRKALELNGYILRVRDNDAVLPITWRTNRILRVDAAGELECDPSFPYAVEFDGNYFHHQAEKTEIDTVKTIALIQNGYIVIRLRGQGRYHLPDLPLQHPRLLQLKYTEPSTDRSMQDAVSEITRWIEQSYTDFLSEREAAVEPTLTGDYSPGLLQQAEFTAPEREEAFWMLGFARLSEYAEREGHAQVPTYFACMDGYRLDKWVSAQRTRHSRLPPDKVEMLESIMGWTWDLNESRWEKGFAHLLEFVAEHGHAAVPQETRSYDGFDLGGWVSHQRRDNGLSHAKRDRLENLTGWIWNVFDEAWKRGYASLLDYVEETGHASPPARYVQDGFALGMWLSNLKRKRERLTSDKELLLEALPGWKWIRSRATNA